MSISGTPDDLLVLLGTIDGKLDALKELVSDGRDDHKALAARVSAMELTRARERGYAAGIAAVVAFIVAYASHVRALLAGGCGVSCGP